jgi:hypothetical protein
MTDPRPPHPDQDWTLTRYGYGRSLDPNGPLPRSRRDMEAEGFSQLGTQPGDPEGQSFQIRIPTLPPDERPSYLVCELCLITMKKTKGRRVEICPNRFACRVCASLDQDPHWDRDHWLGEYLNYRRALIVVRYRLDPARFDEDDSAVEVQASVTDFRTDVDGYPLAPETRPVMLAYVDLRMPRCRWSLLAEKGRGIF